MTCWGNTIADVSHGGNEARLILWPHLLKNNVYTVLVSAAAANTANKKHPKTFC